MIQNVKPQAYRWSRATYVMVAGTIAELYRDTDSPTIWDVIAKFQAAFRVDNPRFDGARFRLAALANLDGERRMIPAEGENTDISYDSGAYLLIDGLGNVVAVSGNRDFWDCEGTMPTISQDEVHTIVKVVTNA